MLDKSIKKSNIESIRAAHDNLVNEIILAISALNVGRFWNQPTGAAYRSGVIIRYGLIGCADITGILQDGRRVEIEVKTGKAKQTEEQLFFQSMISMMKGIYFVARNVNDTVEFIRNAATSRPK